MQTTNDLAISTLEGELEKKKEALSELQNEYAQKLIVLTEAEVAVKIESDGIKRLETALAALKGEAPLPEKPAVSPEESVEEPEKPPATEPSGGKDVADMSPEEFEAHLEEGRKRRKQAEKAQQEEGPYAGVQCKSCGSVGTLFDSTQTIKGKMVPIIACSGCSSISYVGR